MHKGLCVSYHAVCDYTAWRRREAGKKTQWMTTVHHKGLLFSHGAQIVKYQPELYKHTHYQSIYVEKGV